MPASHVSRADLPCTSAKPSRRRSSMLFTPPAAGSSGSKANPRSAGLRSEEHTSELQSLMRISYAVFCLKKKTNTSMNTYDIVDSRRRDTGLFELPNNDSQTY